MRTVFTNNEIVHVWASQNQSEGRANSMRFSGPTIFSYAMPIGQFQKMPDGTPVVLLDRTSRSITTSGHQHRTAMAVDHLKSIEVGAIDRYGKVVELNHSWYIDEIDTAVKKAARARSQWMQDNHLGRAGSLADDMQAYSKIFSLAWEVPVIPSDLAQVKLQVRQKSKEKAKIELAKKLAESMTMFFAGGRLDHRLGQLPTELRVVGNHIETTRGATFPIAHGKLALGLVDGTMKRGEQWTPNGHSCRLGHYQINRITPDGTVYAGCHVVKYAAIQRIREQVMAYAEEK